MSPKKVLYLCEDGSYSVKDNVHFLPRKGEKVYLLGIEWYVTSTIHYPNLSKYGITEPSMKDIVVVVTLDWASS